MEIIDKKNEAPLCGCGCGEKVKWGISRRKWNKFLSHHNIKGKNHPSYKGGKIKTFCDYCQIPIKIWPFEQKKNKRHFCNHECHGKWNSKNIIGKNHPNHGNNTKVIEYCKY